METRNTDFSIKQKPVKMRCCKVEEEWMVKLIQSVKEIEVWGKNGVSKE